MEGELNRAYSQPEGDSKRQKTRRVVSIELNTTTQLADDSVPPKRDAWANDWEFLMSCIAMSVGLGNVWRFPFVALENGGGAFLIPYLVVLFIIGRPIYYLEMLIGQFSSRGSVQVYDMAPAMRGIGYGQVLALSSMLCYYTSLVALALRYFLASFQSVLPWSVCQPEWGPQCIDSGMKMNNFSRANQMQRITSAELYFYKEILKEAPSLDDGIGLPDIKLCLCLAFSWICITLIVSRGIQSSGKASYFLALFPYITLGILLVRAVTLPAAMDGIMVFLTPQWHELLNVKVWFAAITQVFYSLAVCIGPIIMYSSFNQFRHNIYRDAMIVTSLDTFTSVMAGVIIFGILGNLAHETGTTDITAVVQGGTGLAFVSYPDAISKFDFWPQAFAVNFFFMLFVLGIGCVIGAQVCVTSLLRDRFKALNRLWLMIGMGFGQFILGCMFLTPGGQYLLNLVDFHSVSFVLIVMAIAELATISWIYGTKRLCRDIEFMLGIKTGWYWRTCWTIVAPSIMIVVLIYQLFTMEALKYNGKEYPTRYAVAGWCLSIIGLIQIPLWLVYGVYRQRGECLGEKIKVAFSPLSNWGPMDGELFEQYRKFMNTEGMVRPNGLWKRFCDNAFG